MSKFFVTDRFNRLVGIVEAASSDEAAAAVQPGAISCASVRLPDGRYADLVVNAQQAPFTASPAGLKTFNPPWQHGEI